MSRQYSVTEAASELGVHVNTLRKWVDKGRVAAIVLPTGRRRFTQEQLDQIKRDIGITPKTASRVTSSDPSGDQPNQDLEPSTQGTTHKRDT